MKKNGIQAVKFRVTLKGHGVVNFDGKDQKYFNKAHCASNCTYNDNQTFSKKEYYRLYDTDAEYQAALQKYAEQNETSVEEAKKNVPEYGYYLKISRACLRNSIFEGTADSDPLIWSFPGAATAFIANPLGYMRGYMCAAENSFKKKSSVNVTDAVDKKAVIYSETFTKSGDRNSTSFYLKETAGDTEYTFDVIFDVAEAQFLSCDDFFARRAVPDEYFEGSNMLGKAFEKRYGRIPYTQGIYSKNNEIFGGTYGENGFLMDDQYVNDLIKNLTDRLLKLNILRLGGDVHASKLEYKPIYSALDIMDSEDGWSNVTSVDDIPDFEIRHFYEEASHADWEDRQRAINEKKQTEAGKKAVKKTAKAKK